MALANGYAVVVGTVLHHRIEPPDREGRWPHYQIFVKTPAGTHECVINLKSRTEIKLEYRDFRDLDRSAFTSILTMADGLHPLPATPTSGALDVIRHPGLLDAGCQCTRWWLESGPNVVDLMEFYLNRVSRVYLFGEPYTTGLGLHNIHQNQGDPVGSPFAAENAIWQDGGVLLEYTAPQPRLSVMLTKFETQSHTTDNSGRV
ncbi:MAG: YukJ family protein [Chloroflexota bacterium]|nr:YukJ family protein [Chloroflexota bacterium]